MKAHKIIVILLFVSGSIFSQMSQQKLDSLLLSRIPYNAKTAKKDIGNNDIMLLRLSGIGVFGDPYNTMDELAQIEQRFGFTYLFDHIEVPSSYVQIAMKEYNDIIYQYLDSIHQMDSRNEILIESKRLFFERMIIREESLKELTKRIKKTLRKESKELQSIIINADLLYQSQNYKMALIKYESQLNKVESDLGRTYIETSIYHCYICLKEYDKAMKMYQNNENINRVIKRTKPNKPS